MVAAWNMVSGMILATCLLVASMIYTFIFSMREHWSISYLAGAPYERMTMDCKLLFGKPCLSFTATAFAVARAQFNTLGFYITNVF